MPLALSAARMRVSSEDASVLLIVHVEGSLLFWRSSERAIFGVCRGDDVAARPATHARGGAAAMSASRCTCAPCTALEARGSLATRGRALMKAARSRRAAHEREAAAPRQGQQTRAATWEMMRRSRRFRRVLPPRRLARLLLLPQCRRERAMNAVPLHRRSAAQHGEAPHILRALSMRPTRW